jgi:hypothetical protein
MVYLLLVFFCSLKKSHCIVFSREAIFGGEKQGDVERDGQRERRARELLPSC